jgi:hypothetical protein
MLLFKRDDVTDLDDISRGLTTKLLWLDVLLPRLAQLYPEDFPAENRAVRNEKTEYTVML